MCSAKGSFILQTLARVLENRTLEVVSKKRWLQISGGVAQLVRAAES